MAETKPSVSMDFKQSIISLSLWLATEIEICAFGGEKSELPRGDV